jgi:hypothetical protein
MAPQVIFHACLPTCSKQPCTCSMAEKNLARLIVLLDQPGAVHRLQDLLSDKDEWAPLLDGGVDDDKK